MGNNSHLFDLIVIGAGPAGLACAIEAKKAGLDYLVVDKGGVVDAIQHFERNMFFFSTPELLEIGNVPFIVPTMRPTTYDCVNYYRRVTDHYGLNCQFFTRIERCIKRDGEFLLKDRHGNEYRARNVVIATGYYDTPIPLCVPGEDMQHVTHYYKDPLPYYQGDVLVVGGKNSAVEAALDLWRHGARVTVVHRGETLSSGIKYWILPDFENRVKQNSITLHLGTTVKEFKPRLALLRDSTGKEWEMKTDAVFILIGYRPDTSFLSSFGITINPESLEPSYDPETMETNVPGLFVAGGLVGGKFNNKVFIENGRQHGAKIVGAIVNKANV